MYVWFFREIQLHGTISITSGKLVEPGWIFLNKLFVFSKWGYIAVFAISIFCAYYMFYRQAVKYDLVLWGTFMFIIFGMIVKHENVLRHNIAIAIGFISFDYVYKKSFLKFLLLVVFATFFHYSSILLIPLCFLLRYLLKANVKPFVSFSFIVIGILLVHLNLFSIIFTNVIALVPYYNEMYAEMIKAVMMNSSKIGPVGIVAAFISWLPHWYVTNYHKELLVDDKIKLIINASWFITVFIVWFYQLPFLSRPFDFIMWFKILGIALFVKLLFSDIMRKKNPTHVVIMVAVLFNLIILRAHFIYGYYGNYMYKTIFSVHCKKQEYYKRFNMLDGENPNERDHIFVIKTN